MTKNEIIYYINWLISLEYSSEYIFNFFMFLSKVYLNDDDELKREKKKIRKIFLEAINSDIKYEKLQRLNEACIYLPEKEKKGEIDIEKEKLIKKIQSSRNNIKDKKKYFTIDNIFKRCCIRELKENANKKGNELENISGDEGVIDKNHNFTMPHFKNPEYQFFSFTLETYSKLEEYNSICHPLRNKKRLTEGEKEEKAYFEEKISELLKEATVIDCDKKDLSECIIELSKLEGKTELSEADKINMDKLKGKKDKLERKINRIL